MAFRLATLGILGLSLSSTAAYAGTLTVVASNQLRNSDGSFRCCLFAFRSFRQIALCILRRPWRLLYRQLHSYLFFHPGLIRKAG